MPRFRGTAAYLKRRYETRPNVAHVVKVGEDLECSIACQDEVGGRRNFFVEGRFRVPRAESTAELNEKNPRERAKGVDKVELLFFVRAPASESGKEEQRVEELRRAVVGKAVKEKPEAVPLMAWLLWLLKEYDEACTLPAARADFLRGLTAALQEELGRAPPGRFLEECVASQLSPAKAYQPKSKKVKRSCFLPHVPDTAAAKMEAVCGLLAKALAVQLLQLSPDALPSTKSMNSAADVWERLLRQAVLQGLAGARRAALGQLERKSKDAEGKKTSKTVLHDYSGSFEAPDEKLMAQCSRPSSPPVGAPASVTLDAFSEYSCRSPQEEGFHFLHEKACAWDLCSTLCPMCGAEYDPRHNVDLPGELAWRCHLCRFPVSLTHHGFELCRVVTSRKEAKEAPKDWRRQRLFFALDVAKHLASSSVGHRLLRHALMGHAEEGKKPKVGNVIAPGTENSAKGTNSRRGENALPELPENLIDCRASKDNNPDLKVYLLTGSSVQKRPSSEELGALLERVAAAAAWSERGSGRLEVRGRTLLRFEASEVHAVMHGVRAAAHEAAWKCRRVDLAMCCPVLSYSSSGPVVTLLCSGRELLRAAGWRALTKAEQEALEALKEGRGFSTEALPASWKDLGTEGLTWDKLVYAGVVTYCALDPHVVLKESARELSASDGLSFYRLSPELESAMRVLQTEDAATWQAGHPIRQGYSVCMALNAHKAEPLTHSRGSISSLRSVGYDPCRSNMRNLVGCAPDNHYGSSLKLMAVLHDFGTIMQEDSMPESADAFRHLTFRSQSLFFTAGTHWESNFDARLGHAALLCKHVEGKSCVRDVGEHLDDRTGLVEKPYRHVRRGQALGFVLGGDAREEAKHLLVEAPCDLWVKKILVEAFSEAGKTRYRYEVQYLTLELYGEGQKLGKLYQKFVSVFLEDWISGGRGRVTGLLSSSSISSRTAVQNLTRAWMTSLALASGVGTLDLVNHLSEEAAFVREVLQSSRPLSASALTELRRRTPGSSVSNQGPMVSGRQGRYFGSCVQVMMSVFVAVQDASRPNGSVNGLNEAGRSSPGCVRLDPIMTEVYRFLGFERPEEAGAVSGEGGAPLACSACGKFSTSGKCDCTDSRGQKRPMRGVNVNPAFQRSGAALACLNVDVFFEWERKHAEAPPVDVDVDDAQWAAVPQERGCATMLDARRTRRTRREERAEGKEKLCEGKRFGLSFGGCPVGRVVADQFVFAMRALKMRAAWDSGDRTDGYTVVAHGSKELFAGAVKRAAGDLAGLRRHLEVFKESGEELPLEGLRAVGGGLCLGVESGGTLQLHTSDERTKQLVIGVMSYANSAKHAHRAFLAEAPELELLPVRNPSYSDKETCNEQELRSEFERNVLGYLYLATTLALLPLRRGFRKSGTVVKAELRFPPGSSHVSASHICGEDGEPLFFKDVVLGANPHARGWCGEGRLGLKFVVFSARVEHHPTAWEEVRGLAESLEKGASCQDPGFYQRLDGALTSSPPALTGIDQRPVFEARLRDAEAFEQLDKAVCGYGVLQGSDLLTASRMHCVNCQDCTRYHDARSTTVTAAVGDIEDTASSASSYFRRIDSGSRRRIFEQGGGGLKARRTRGSPLSIAAREGLWAFRCCTDEDVSYLRSALPSPTRLEELPGMGASLRGEDEEAEAEKEFLGGFFRRHGGPAAWVERGHAAVQLLLESAEELELALKVLAEKLVSD